MIGSYARPHNSGHLEADDGDEELARVYAPIGLDLGGTSPGEIAVAIWLKHRRTVGGTGGYRSHRLSFTLMTSILNNIASNI
jgi:hypothetical protein